MASGLRETHKAGYLEKQGGNNRAWKKRWFVLTSDSILYYKACGDKTAAGEIKLSDVSLALESEGDYGDSSRFCFDIRTPERVYCVAADSRALRTAWVDAVNTQLPPERVAKAKKGFLGGYLKSGWLMKEGGNYKANRPRWCCVSGRSFDYFKQKGAKTPAGSILMADVEAIETNPSNNKCFHLRVPGRTFIFTTDSPEKVNSWIACLEPLLNSGMPRTAVYGVDLATSAARSNVGGVPTIVNDAIEYLDKVLTTEGILRLSGSATEIGEFKAQYDAGLRVNLNETQDPHVVAGLLKLYVRELPEPLLTFNFYEAFMACRYVKNTDSQLRFLRTLVSQLPKISQVVLEVLLPFLDRVTKQSAVNKMHLENVSVVFGPNLLKSKDEDPMTMMHATPNICKICAMLIEFHEFLFSPIDHSPYLCCCMAMYDYQAQQSHEIDLKEGTIVFVTRTDLPASEGWWEGETAGVVGLFPQAYVVVMNEFKVPKKGRANTSTSDLSKRMTTYESSDEGDDDDDETSYVLSASNSESNLAAFGSLSSLSHMAVPPPAYNDGGGGGMDSPSAAGGERPTRRPPPPAKSKRVAQQESSPETPLMHKGFDSDDELPPTPSYTEVGGGGVVQPPPPQVNPPPPVATTAAPSRRAPPPVAARAPSNSAAAANGVQTAPSGRPTRAPPTANIAARKASPIPKKTARAPPPAAGISSAPATPVAAGGAPSMVGGGSGGSDGGGSGADTDMATVIAVLQQELADEQAARMVLEARLARLEEVITKCDLWNQ